MQLITFPFIVSLWDFLCFVLIKVAGGSGNPCIKFFSEISLNFIYECAINFYIISTVWYSNWLCARKSLFFFLHLMTMKKYFYNCIITIYTYNYIFIYIKKYNNNSKWYKQIIKGFCQSTLDFFFIISMSSINANTNF